MDPFMKVQHIHVTMRGDKDIDMEVQHIIASGGGKNHFMKVHHIIYFKEGGPWRNKAFE